jgi:hypothetical protein
MFGGAAPAPGREAAEQFLARVKRIEQATTTRLNER